MWELRSSRPECTRKLRNLLLQPYHGALRWCPRTLPLPSETLKHMALWTLPCVLLRLWRCPPAAQLAPSVSGGVLQVRRSSSDRVPSDSRSELSFHTSSPDGWLRTLVLLSWHPTLEIVSHVFHCLSTVALASGKLQSFSNRNGLVYQAIMKNLPHTTFRRYGPYVATSLFRMLLYVLNQTCSSLTSIEVTMAWGSPRLSFFSMHGIAGAVSFPMCFFLLFHG